LVPDWMDTYFPGNGALLNTVVELAKGCRGLTGRDILQLLFEFGGDVSAKQVTAGCRLVLDYLLADLLEQVHQASCCHFSFGCGGGGCHFIVFILVLSGGRIS
jgi:hypothetical protein